MLIFANTRTFVCLGLCVSAALVGCSSGGEKDPDPPRAVGASKDAPEWVKTRSDPKYPDAEYLVGFGFTEGQNSDAKKAAIRMARIAIAEEIEVKIKDELKSIIKEISDDGNSKLTVDVTNITEQEVEALFRGSRPVAEYDDPNGSTYALVVLNRPTVIDQFLKNAEQGVKDAREFLVTAQGSLSAGEPSPALEAMLRAIKKSQEAQKSAAQAIGIRRNDDVKVRARALDIGSLITDAVSQLSSMMSNVEMVAIAGDGQDGALNSALSPMRVKAVWKSGDREEPLSRFPVVITAEHPAKLNLIPTERTNSEGIAQAQITELQLTGKANNTVRFALDFTPFSGNYAEAYSVATTLTYRMPTVENSTILIAITESIHDQKLDSSQAANLIAAEFSKKDFPVIKGDASLSAEQIAAMDPNTLRERLGNRAKYIITGSVKARYEGLTGPTHLSVADIDLRAIELVSGQSISIFVDSNSDGSEGWSSDSARESGRKAINNAMKEEKIAPRLLKVLEARLAGGEFREKK